MVRFRFPATRSFCLSIRSGCDVIGCGRSFDNDIRIGSLVNEVWFKCWWMEYFKSKIGLNSDVFFDYFLIRVYFSIYFTNINEFDYNSLSPLNLSLLRYRSTFKRRLGSIPLLLILLFRTYAVGFLLSSRCFPLPTNQWLISLHRF